MGDGAQLKALAVMCFLCSSCRICGWAWWGGGQKVHERVGAQLKVLLAVMCFLCRICWWAAGVVGRGAKGAGVGTALQVAL